MVRFINDALNGYQPGPNGPKLQVLALGLPRCATSSLQAALEQLGYAPCMHMAYVQPNVQRTKLVTAAALEKNKAERQAILAELFNGFAATADFPGTMFVEDLMEMYPNAAIVLNQRKNAEDWYRSWVDAIGFFNTPFFRGVTTLVRSDRCMMRMLKACEQLNQERWGRSFWDKEMYDIHNNWVRESAKKRGRQVLEFQASHGWPALCGFLGVNSPPGSYPRVNDQRTMTIVKGIVVIRGLVHWVGLLLLLWLILRYAPVAVPTMLLTLQKSEL